MQYIFFPIQKKKIVCFNFHNMIQSILCICVPSLLDYDLIMSSDGIEKYFFYFFMLASIVVLKILRENDLK